MSATRRRRPPPADHSIRAPGLARLVLAIALCLLPVAAAAFDVERAFRNFDLVATGEISAAELTEEERAEVLIIQNTFDQLERNNDSVLDWVDCQAAETLVRQQAVQLGALASRLASCARREDLSGLAAAAGGLASCARTGGGLDSCNARMRNVERYRDEARPCLAELRSALREQRHLATFRLREAEMCPVEPVL